MALKVWLPLNGDLNNYGCSELTTTNSGSVVNTAGKIGSCYSFDGSDDYISINCSALYSIFTGQTQPFSIAFWVYHNDSTRAVIFGDYGLSGTIQFNIELTTAHKLRFYWNGSPDKNFTDDVGLQQWTHIAITYNGSRINLYKNGVKSSDSYSGALSAKNKTSGDFYLGRDSRTGTTAFNGKLNDVRIYNHCLSAAEVKEISQGLVLHYTMNYTNPNLAIGSRSLDLTQGISNTYWGLRQAPPTIKKDGFTVATVNVAFRGVSCWANSLNLVAGNNYTISCTGYTNNATNTNVNLYFYPMMYNSSGTRDTATTIPISVMGGPFTNVNSKLISKMSVIPTRYWATFTWTTAMADLISNGGKVEISLQVSGTFNEGDLQSIYAPKLENGDVPTPWRPSLSEEGLSQDVMFDSSGYNHNGIINNFVKPSADTRRGLMALHLVNGNSMINCGRGGMVTDSITVNMWIKASSWANPVSCTESGGWNFESNSGSITFPVYITDVGYVQTKNGANAEIIASATVTDNTWHMLTGVYDRVGQTVKLYLDGELKQQNTVSAPKLIKYHPSNSIWIGGEATASSASNGMAGLFSDFRIYCTPLLDNDIKLLYNIGMKVDNGHELHCFELKESTNNRELLQGINIVSGYTAHTNLRRPYQVNSNGELYFSTSDSAGTAYIPITPTGHTYYYDIEVSIDANNQFYLGFERYDANKTSRNNNACVYVISTKPTTALSHKRYYGTVDLSTDGVNPCAFITLRILNAWSSTTGTATIHKLSLREVTTLQNPKLYKTGTFLTDEFNEHQRASFYNNGFVEATEFIEI